jgi:hypothetical protein
MTFLKQLSTALTLLGVLATVGCGKKVAVHPGAISNLDSYAYDVLLAEQDVLNQAKSDYQAGTLGDNAKAPLNAAIAQYNVTQDLWQTYHATGAGADKLSQAVAVLVTLLGDIQKLRGKSTAPVPASNLTWPNQIPLVQGAL